MSSPLTLIIAERVSQLRQQRKLTQLSLAVKIGVSQESISAIETGKVIPKVETLINLSDFFNCSLDYLVGFSDVKRAALNQSQQVENEQLLVSNFRQCSANDKNNLMIISAILAKENIEIEVNGNTVLVKNFLDIE